jgi:hypothetical protein
MSRCYCGCVLGVLVIVLAWLPVSWANIALTILGALLVIKALIGTCCCAAKLEQAESETAAGTGQ